MRRYNATARSPAAAIARDLRQLTEQVSGARSAEIRRAAVVFRRSIKTVLSARRGGPPSRPGEVPKYQRGSLAKSAFQGLVETGRRVGASWFTAPLFEEGVNTMARRRSGHLYRLVIQPRPFMNRALQLARPTMLYVVVQGGGDEAAALARGSVVPTEAQ